MSLINDTIPYIPKKKNIPPPIKTNRWVFLTCLLSSQVGHLTSVAFFSSIPII